MSNAETTHSEISGAAEADQAPGVSFAELRRGRCKFALGGKLEPVTRFCGSKTPEGSSYCSAHRRIVYRPVGRGGY